MNIQDVIRLDHNKVNTLFTEVGQSDDPQKLQEYFGQNHKDLLHILKQEEQVVYPPVRSFYPEDKVQELYDEQGQFRQPFDEIKAVDPLLPLKMNLEQVKSLMDAVGATTSVKKSLTCLPQSATTAALSSRNKWRLSSKRLKAKRSEDGGFC